MSNEPVAIKVDYGARTDDQPIYIGKAPAGTVDATLNWVVHKLGYTSDRLVQFDTKRGISWTNRASPESDGQSVWSF